MSIKDAEELLKEARKIDSKVDALDENEQNKSLKLISEAKSLRKQVRDFGLEKRILVF